MIDMYGSDIAVGDMVITWVKEGEGCVLRHVEVIKVNPITVEFKHFYTTTGWRTKTFGKIGKRKSNQIILLPPF